MTMTHEPVRAESISGAGPPELRLVIGPIGGFGQANMLLQRLQRVPGVRALRLHDVAGGAIVVDLWLAGTTRLDGTLRAMWGDHPGTQIAERHHAAGPREVVITLGRRPRPA